MAKRLIVEYGPTVAALRKLATKLPKNLQEGAKRHGEFAVRLMKADLFKPYPGPYNEDRARDFLYKRTGKLQRSIRTGQISKNGGITVSAGRGISDDRAYLNEMGGVVTGTPLIEIPLPAALTQATGQRKARFRSVEDALANGAFRSEKNNNVLLIKTSKGVEAVYVEKESVFHPARFHFFDTFRDSKSLRKNRAGHLKAAVRQSIAETFGRSQLA